jgi:hypothetical protein
MKNSAVINRGHPPRPGRTANHSETPRPPPTTTVTRAATLRVRSAIAPVRTHSAYNGGGANRTHKNARCPDLSARLWYSNSTLRRGPFRIRIRRFVTVEFHSPEFWPSPVKNPPARDWSMGVNGLIRIPWSLRSERRERTWSKRLSATSVLFSKDHHVADMGDSRRSSNV